MLVIGMKSYGRNSAFLLKIGHQQVREDDMTPVVVRMGMHAAVPCIRCYSAIVRALTRRPLRVPASLLVPALACGVKVDDAMALMTAQINELSGA